jgi:ATP-dependent protease ClpP protease subunit
MRQWYTMKASDKAAEILIYDEIGASYWGDDTITAKQFIADLEALGDVDAITLRVNSPGGDVFDGVAIHNAVKNHKATVTAQVDGIAASAASFIVMAADKIIMPSNSFMLIHGASGFAWGTADTVRSLADDLDRIDKSLTATYAARSNSTVEQVQALMKEDRLMDAEEAKSLGYADELTEPVKMAAKFSLRLLPKAAADLFRAAAAEPEPQPEVQPEPQPTAEIVQLRTKLTTAKQTGAAEHKAYVASITDLCVLAGMAERVGGFVAAGTSVDDARKELLLARAAEPQIMPHHPLIDSTKATATMWGKITDKLNARSKRGA